MNNIEQFLAHLKENSSTLWLANEIEETISQGISMNAKEAATIDSELFELVPTRSLGPRERKKRQKYETTRPFTEQEKLDLILKALERVYLDLPTIKNTAIKNLTSFSPNVQSVLFVKEDEAGETHDFNIENSELEQNSFKEAYQEFINKLNYHD